MILVGDLIFFGASCIVGTTATSTTTRLESFVKSKFQSIRRMICDYIIVKYYYNYRQGIIIIPPPQLQPSLPPRPSSGQEKTTNATKDNNSGNGQEQKQQPQQKRTKNILLIIFPGALIDQREYISIGKEFQKQFSSLFNTTTTTTTTTSTGKGTDPTDSLFTLPADVADVDVNVNFDWQVTVGIGPLMYRLASPFVRWIFDDDNVLVATWIRKLAVLAVAAAPNANSNSSAAVLENQNNNNNNTQQQQDDDQDISTSSYFDDIFVWGHSAGCYGAIDVAYSSMNTGLITYGASWGIFRNKEQDLISFPRPILTMMGDRDGFLRYLLLSKDLKCRKQQDQLIKSDNSYATTTTTTTKLSSDECSKNNRQQKRMSTLEKPIVLFPELKHLHMGTGIPPLKTTLSGRSDLTSIYDSRNNNKDPLLMDIQIPQSIMAKTVADFVFIHSNRRHLYQSQQRQKQHTSTFNKQIQAAKIDY